MRFDGKPGHSYALLPSAARQLGNLARGGNAGFADHMKGIVTGTVPGLVCAQCGVSIAEIIAAGVLCIETSPLSSLECLPRRSAVRAMLECDFAGTPPFVCYDELRELGDLLSAPPWRRDTIRLMRDATVSKLEALVRSAGGMLPVLGVASIDS